MWTERELAYLYWLYSIRGIGKKTWMVLTAFGGSGEEIYRMPESALKGLVNQRQLQELLACRNNWDVEGEYQRLLEKGISFYPYGHPQYSEKLMEIPDPPAALYVKGRLPDSGSLGVAVIGTRKCSGYGSFLAKELGSGLAAAGIPVISGMAEGIDGISQRAAVAAGGSTFGVLGCGVDVCYPKENRSLYEQIPERGGILSEYAPGTQPRAALFPPRNRIISGLSDVVVVVEAREQSGTMITVDMALEQGREVYAVPGRLVDASSGGCNRLIRQGAGVILSVREFLEDLGIRTERKEPETGEEKGTRNKMPERAAEITEEERRVLACLDYELRSLEEVAGECGNIPIYHLSGVLVSLCVKGWAEQRGTGRYCRKSKSS